jgi:long-chain acyl-CoA synthetase
MTATETTSIAREPAAMAASTLCEAFQLTAAERSQQVALRAFGSDVEVTWGEYARRVRAIAAGLHGIGVRRGDTVALMLTNRPEFHLVDTAAFHLGATPFSIYNSSSVEQAEYLFTNAGNTVVVCEQALLPIITQARRSVPALEHVVVIDADVDGTITLADLEAAAVKPFDFEAAWRAVQPQDVLTLIYTSGTTGSPKGVQLTHANMIAEIRGIDAVLPTTPGGRHVSWAPSAHISDRMLAYYGAAITFGATVTSVADQRQLAAALAEVHPTTWVAVPLVWEKLMAALVAGGVSDPAAMPEQARAQVRAKLGLDEAEWMASGSAPIPEDVLRFYLDLGLPICEVWGMSELSCFATINPPHDIRIGTVGKAMPGVELALLDDGELLARGDIVMKGYRGDPERTAEALDADGWIHTGDVAVIDADGYVRIVDRKKELIISSAGKNMSPANIEQKLKASSALIGQAICIGDRRPYNVALLTIDPDAAARFAADHGCSADPAHMRQRADVQAEIARGIDAANVRLSRVEQIKNFQILDVDWQPGEDELTPTMKLKRKPIHAKYAAQIEALYTPGPQVPRESDPPDGIG